jgi:hypothetical protein
MSASKSYLCCVHLLATHKKSPRLRGAKQVATALKVTCEENQLPIISEGGTVPNGGSLG